MPTEPVGPVEVVVVAAEMGAVHQVEEEKEEEEKMRVPGIVVSRRWDYVFCEIVCGFVSVFLFFPLLSWYLLQTK